jgi:two-component sensor histidine kinase
VIGRGGLHPLLDPGSQTAAAGAPSSAKQARTRHGWPIAGYLIGVALASSIPIAIVAALLSYSLVATSAQQKRSEFAERLRLFRAGLELRMSNVVEDLQVLARAPSLQNEDFATLRPYATQVVDVIGSDGLVVVDRSGQQVFATRQPPGAALPRRSNLETQDRVFATGSPQISDLIHAVADGRPIISVEVPVRVAGEIKYVLAVGLSPKYLAEVMKQYVPEGMVGSIIDRSGILISRVPLLDGADLVGQPTIPAVRERIGSPSGSWIETISRTGIPYYSSFLRSDQTGWTVNMALPREAIDGAVRQTTLWFSLMVVATLLLGLLLARLAGNQIRAAVLTLEGQVRRLGERQSGVEESTSVAEINRMQRVLTRVSRDIRDAEQAVERERALLRATVEAMPVGVLLVTPEGAVSVVNSKMLSLWDVKNLHSLNEDTVVTRFHLDGTPYPMREWPITQALQSGKTTEGEEAIHVIDGVRRNVAINAVPVYDEAGRLAAAVSTVYDITELREALRRQQVLLDEVNHRVKNTLATVHSIARLSAASASSLKDYLTGFEQRLHALSAAYNLLTQNNWEGADLKEIVERTLAPYATNGRLSISGPAAMLSAKHSLGLAAAVQELSTNAAKYGALSVPDGKVAISWSLNEAGAIAFEWRESDGPSVSPPSRRGFGSKLIQDVLAGDSGWKVKVEYRPEGVHCSLTFDAGQ